jgi:hypothetical protein
MYPRENEMPAWMKGKYYILRPTSVGGWLRMKYELGIRQKKIVQVVLFKKLFHVVDAHLVWHFWINKPWSPFDFIVLGFGKKNNCVRLRRLELPPIKLLSKDQWPIQMSEKEV